MQLIFFYFSNIRLYFYFQRNNEIFAFLDQSDANLSCLHFDA